MSDSDQPRPIKIISGGQTGVDRAALDVAIELSLPHGGWCPRGRRAEDGRIGDEYHLRETRSRRYFWRTLKNVVDSDATLILGWGELTGGTELTRQLAVREEKPHLCVDLAARPSPADAASWLARVRPLVLNVAGPRESTAPGIGEKAKEFLREILASPPPEE